MDGRSFIRISNLSSTVTGEYSKTKRASLIVSGELKIKDCWKHSARLIGDCGIGGGNLTEEHASGRLRRRRCEGRSSCGYANKPSSAEFIRKITQAGN
jgi:hypothetical protein